MVAVLFSRRAQALPKAAPTAAATAAAAAAASRGAGQAGGKTAKAGGSSDASSGSDADDGPAAAANGGGVSTGDSSSGEESGQGGFDLAKLKAKSGKRRTAGAMLDASKGKPAVAAVASKKKSVSCMTCTSCACLGALPKQSRNACLVRRGHFREHQHRSTVAYGCMCSCACTQVAQVRMLTSFAAVRELLLVVTCARAAPGQALAARTRTSALTTVRVHHQQQPAPLPMAQQQQKHWARHVWMRRKGTGRAMMRSRLSWQQQRQRQLRARCVLSKVSCVLSVYEWLRMPTGGVVHRFIAVCGAQLALLGLCGMVRVPQARCASLCATATCVPCRPNGAAPKALDVLCSFHC